MNLLGEKCASRKLDGLTKKNLWHFNTVLYTVWYPELGYHGFTILSEIYFNVYLIVV